MWNPDFLTNTSATFVKNGHRLILKGQHCPLVAASSVARALLIRIISSGSSGHIRTSLVQCWTCIMFDAKTCEVSIELQRAEKLGRCFVVSLLTHPNSQQRHLLLGFYFTTNNNVTFRYFTYQFLFNWFTDCFCLFTASKKPGEPLIISDIKKGSMAHRSHFILNLITCS